MTQGSNPQTASNDEYRKLPAVDAILGRDDVAPLIAQYGVSSTTSALRMLLAQARRAIAGGARAPDDRLWSMHLATQLAAASLLSLRPVINATGVIIHTNLGRAPLSAQARAAVNAVAEGYSNLEYDLDTGTRGSRHDHAQARLCELTGAEDAMIVNNNAATVYLVLAALCAPREVIVSRGELVEIGGGFRIPDVLRQSGCRLVEVGATNRTHAHDFSRALSADTAALMRIHSSNFRRIGFVSEPTLLELTSIAHGHRNGNDTRALVIDDLGSGALLDTSAFGIMAEPMVQQSVAAGADLITFSGDKLLGGPQSGLIVGRKDLLTQLRRHPMARAVRVDKMTLAALDATLLSYQLGRAPAEIPIWQMIGATTADLEQRARRWHSELGALAETDVLAGESTVGGGSLPGETLPTHLLAVKCHRLDELARRLRAAEAPVVGRIQQKTLLLDPRTVLPDQEAALLNTVREALVALDTAR